MESKKKVQDTKAVDSELRENPFQTAYGQEIVSIEESFESRLFREGRPLNNFSQNSNVNASVLTGFANVKPSGGCIFYPMTIMLSCDVDAVLQISYNTAVQKVGVNSNGVVYDTVFVKGGTPVIVQPKGIKIYEGGSVQLGVIPTANGKVTGSIYGIEVTDNA